jgi:hypothetical protein
MVTARELVGLSPTADEITWAREQTRSESHLLALVLSLKCFQRLGYFPTLEEIPEVVLLHVRRCLGLKEDVGPTRGERTATTQRVLVRRRVGVTYDPERALAVAADAIRTAAAVKNNPPDLINVALEMLVRASLELPGFATLNQMTSRIRSEVNTAMFEQIVARISLPDRLRLEGLLEVTGPRGKSAFNRLKQAAGRASWAAFPGTGPARGMGRFTWGHTHHCGHQDRRLRRGGSSSGRRRHGRRRPAEADSPARLHAPHRQDGCQG